MPLSPSSSTPTPTSARYTLSLHDALPILRRLPQVCHAHSRSHSHSHCFPLPTSPLRCGPNQVPCRQLPTPHLIRATSQDRKSTRLHSSHVRISYAVFSLKKKKTNYTAISS